MARHALAGAALLDRRESLVSHLIFPRLPHLSGNGGRRRRFHQSRSCSSFARSFLARSWEPFRPEAGSA
jgi:hypothetical protein